MTQKALEPGTGLLYMKVGTHANEPLEEIIRRKQKEIDEAGFAYWGYGGNTCHPTSMVQPFVQSHVAKGASIYLLMEPMVSKHFADPVRAEEYSVNGFEWHRIPQEINARGSRYALVIDSLETEDLTLPLESTRVAYGNSLGLSGESYIKGRVDKACLEVVGTEGQAQSSRVVKIGLAARLAKPYAVFLRNLPPPKS